MECVIMMIFNMISFYRDLFTALGNLCMNGIYALHYKFEMTQAQINRTQEHWDNFGECWHQLHGEHSDTNYIADACTGVFRYFLERFGSLYACANIGLEAEMGVVQNAYACGTNKSHETTKKQIASIFFSKFAAILEKLEAGARKRLMESGHDQVNLVRRKKAANFKITNIKGAWYDEKVKVWRRKLSKGRDANGKITYKMEVFQSIDDITEKPFKAPYRRKKVSSIHDNLCHKNSELRAIILKSVAPIFTSTNF